MSHGGVKDCAHSSLFSCPVDGGHRAIKYSRLGGVKPDIYNEGTHFMVGTGKKSRLTSKRR